MIALSIIMINRNGEKILPFTLKLLIKALRCRNDVELIIVDDNSVDHSLEIIHNLLQESCLQFKHVIALKQRVGPVKARNIGAIKAKGRLLVFMDNDVFIFNDKVFDMIISTFNNDKSIAIVQPMIEPFFEKSSSWGGGGYISPTTFGYIIKQCTRQREIFYPLGSFFAIKKEVFKAIGGFTSEYEYLFEEVSLAWKMHRYARGKAVCVPVKGVKHIGLKKGSPRASILKWRNRLFLVIENLEGKNAFLYCLLLLLRMLYEDPQYALKIIISFITEISNLLKNKKKLSYEYRNNNLEIFSKFYYIIKAELMRTRKESLLAYALTASIYRSSNLHKLLYLCLKDEL